MGKLTFTPEEKIKLRAAGIKFTRLDEYSLNDFFKALNPDEKRKEEIRRMFFVDDELSKMTSPFQFTMNLPSTYFDRMPTFETGAMSMLRQLNDQLNRNSEIIGSVSSVRKIVEAASGSMRGMENISQMSGAMAALRMADAAGSPLRGMKDFSGLSDSLKLLRGFDDHGLSKLRASVTHLTDGVLLGSSIAGSLLDLNSYKKLGIASIAATFRSSEIERQYAGGLFAALKAANDFTRLGEDNLSRFEWATVGSRLAVSDTLIAATQNKFLNFSRSYRDVLKTVSERPNWLYESPVLAELPAEEYYTSSQILRIVSDEAGESESISEALPQNNEQRADYLLEYLPRLDPDLPMMWHGAIYALRSDNPDKIRHFINSLRELFTHVLHILSPDPIFEQWDIQKQYYDNKKPTRQGRLQYICRNMNGSDNVFAKFMQNDIDSTISLIRLFQSGTHKIKSVYSPQELELILIRAELSLRTILRVEFDINRR